MTTSSLEARPDRLGTIERLSGGAAALP